MNEKKTRSTYKVPKFYLDSKPGNDIGAIFLKYTFAPGKRISYFTGYRIELSKWNLKTQRVKGQVTGSSDINDKLNSFSEAAQKAVRESRLHKRPLTKELLKTILDNENGKEINEKTFISTLQEFINTESTLKSWTHNTLKKLSTLKTQLEAFEEFKRKNQRSYRIDINHIDATLFEELIYFWQTEYNLRNTTIQKYIELIRWFFSWCYKNGHINDKYKAIDVNLTITPKKVIYLEMAEIAQIYNAKIDKSKEYLERTRDIFIFQCLTGLRFSDLQNLKASDIKEDRISVDTIKTGETIEIELNDTTRPILAKYKQHQEATGKALPVPVNQVYNRFLKELAKIAELNEPITLVHYKGNERIEEAFKKWELITTHTARRSFITNGLALGIGGEVIRSWTGHQSEKSFKAYYEIVAARKRTDMDKMNL